MRLYRRAGKIVGKWHLAIAERTAPVVVASYPKSGRTWFRVFLSALYQRQFGLSDRLFFTSLRWIPKGIPRVHFTHGFNPREQYSGLTFLSSVQKTIRLCRNKHVIVMVRDPRDVAISSYFQNVKREKILEEDTPIERFVPDEVERVIQYMNAWYEARKQFASLTIARYEDFHADTDSEFKRLLSQIGLHDTPDAAIQDAIAASSFEKMHAVEQSGGAGSMHLKPGDQRDPDSYKTRRGKVGSFRDYLSEIGIKTVTEQLRELHSVFGYSSENDHSMAPGTQTTLTD